MDKAEFEIDRAERAQNLLNNEMLTQAFADTRTAIMDVWAALPDVNSDKARDLHRMLKCLDRVKTVIETHIETGRITQKTIEGKRKYF